MRTRGGEFCLLAPAVPVGCFLEDHDSQGETSVHAVALASGRTARAERDTLVCSKEKTDLLCARQVDDGIRSEMFLRSPFFDRQSVTDNRQFFQRKNVVVAWDIF